VYTPSILSAPLGAAEPVNASQPDGARQSVWEWGDGDVEVGIWECTEGSFSERTGDFDEMMCMVAGRVSVHHADGTFDIAPGTLWVTPRHWDCRWEVHQTVRKLYVIDHRSGGPAPAALLSNAHTATLGEWTKRESLNEHGAEVRQRDTELWRHNQLQVGVWEATAGTFAAHRDGYDEVFLGLSGHATLTSSDGVRFDLGPGSVLCTPSGFRGVWNIPDSFRKAYCIIDNRPNAAATATG
jgi:uncharacterized protein